MIFENKVPPQAQAVRWMALGRVHKDGELSHFWFIENMRSVSRSHSGKTHSSHRFACPSAHCLENSDHGSNRTTFEPHLPPSEPSAHHLFISSFFDFHKKWDPPWVVADPFPAKPPGIGADVDSWRARRAGRITAGESPSSRSRRTRTRRTRRWRMREEEC